MKRSPLAPGKPPQRRSRLRPVGKRGLAKRAARQRCVAAVARRSGGMCEAKVNGVCTGRAVDPHEILTRARRGSITDPENVLAVCRDCHIWIGNNQAAALALGLLASGCGRDNK